MAENKMRFFLAHPESIQGKAADCSVSTYFLDKKSRITNTIPFTGKPPLWELEALSSNGEEGSQVISEEEATKLLAEAAKVKKVVYERHPVVIGGLECTLDHFGGKNSGLVILSGEFPKRVGTAPFVAFIPVWAFKEVKASKVGLKALSKGKEMPFYKEYVKEAKKKSKLLKKAAKALMKIKDAQIPATAPVGE